MCEELPAIMWVVTRERTRAGKPPLKIAPFAYQYSGDKPVGIKTGSQRGTGERTYCLPDCYASLDGARSALEALVVKELHEDQAKLNELRGRMRAAKKAAALLVA